MRIITALAAGIIASAPISASAINETAIQECDLLGSMAGYISIAYQDGDSIRDMRKELGVDAAPSYVQNAFYEIHGTFDEVMAIWDHPERFPANSYHDFWFTQCMDVHRNNEFGGSPTRQSFDW